MKVCKKEYHVEDLDVICNTNHSDFDKEQLCVQLQLLGDNLDVVTADGTMNIFPRETVLSVIQPGAAIVNVASVALLQSILVIPSKNAMFSVIFNFCEFSEVEKGIVHDS